MKVFLVLFFLGSGLVVRNASSQEYTANVTGTCWSVKLGLAFSKNYQPMDQNSPGMGFVTGYSTYDGISGNVQGGLNLDGSLVDPLSISGELKRDSTTNSLYRADFGDFAEAAQQLIQWGYFEINFPNTIMNADSDGDGLPNFLETNSPFAYSGVILVRVEGGIYGAYDETNQVVTLNKTSNTNTGTFTNWIPSLPTESPFVGNYEILGASGSLTINPTNQTIRIQATTFDGLDFNICPPTAYSVQSNGIVRMTNLVFEVYKTQPPGFSLSTATELTMQKLGSNRAKGSLRFVDGDTDTAYVDYNDYHIEITNLDPQAFAPLITNLANTNHLVGQAFNFQPLASQSPSLWLSTNLPGGLNINSSSGLISGTPTNSGSRSVSVVASNAWGATTNTFTLTVVSLASNWFGSLAPTNIAPDGLAYLLKYGYGGRTNSHDGDLRPSMDSQSNQMTFTFFARTNDTNLTILPVSGTNLADPGSWSTSNLTVVSAGTTNRNGETLAIRRVTLPLTNNPEKRFVRLQVQLKNP